MNKYSIRAPLLMATVLMLVVTLAAVAVQRVDPMTQQNAALVEQSAAAAESLKDQASKLAVSMSVFKIAA